MGLSPAMTIARRALLANELLLSVTANNISNISTPGYARQRAVVNEARPQQTGFGSLGQGVVISTIQQVVDPFIEGRLVAGSTQLRDAEVRSDLLSRLESVFPDLEAGGIGKAIEDFFAAANDLATHPQGGGARLGLLASANNVASEFQTRAKDVQALQREADNRLVATVSEVNSLVDEIAGLNREIVAAEIRDNSANALRDKRQVALKKLAEKVNVNYFENQDGSVNVQTLGAITLVSSGRATRLGVSPDSTNTGLDGRALSRFGMLDADGGVIPVGNKIAGGELGALLEIRDGTLVDMSTDLDTLANSFRDAVNAVQTSSAGRDLNGDVGEPLFDPSSAGAADLTVALTDQRKIAAAKSTNPGDNRNALDLAALQDTLQTALGDETFSGYHAEIVTNLGILARSAEDRRQLTSSVQQQLEARREAVSGVSLEEEVTNLIKFQRAFQASASLIGVAQQMLDELVNLVR